MPRLGLIVAVIGGCLATAWIARGRTPPLKLGPGWRIELVAQAPQILYPTAIVSAPDGTIYIGQDPMDMPGPPTAPIDSVVALRDGKVSVFADKLWAVMGLEWGDGALFVVHAPYLSAFRDLDGDGKADQRVDLIKGLGPAVPAFNGINDHIASGIRLGMDGFLYISIGDKGIPRGVGADGTTIQLYGGGVIRIRPDGTGLEVVSTGERNPTSVALSTSDEIFSYGNDDDRKKWPNSLTHHIVSGHHGYPYDFLSAPSRCLPILDGRFGGAGAQGISYNDDGLANRFRGDLFFCDWGLGAVVRYHLEPSGGTFRVKSKEYVVRRGSLGDFRPFSITVGDQGRSLYLTDWAFNGFLVNGPRTGRLYKLSYDASDRAPRSTRPRLDSLAARLGALDHPSHAVRLSAQRGLSANPVESEQSLVVLLGSPGPSVGRIHALWALDAIGTAACRTAIRRALGDPDVDVRTQAARSSGIHRDREAIRGLVAMLRETSAPPRREAAIALGRIGDASSVGPLMSALGDSDRFVDWSIQRAIRSIGVSDVASLAAALNDPMRRLAALALCDEWSTVPVVRALAGAIGSAAESEWRAQLVRAVANLYRRYPEWSGRWFGPDPLAGEFPRKTCDWDPAGMTAVFEALATSASDRDPTVRRAAIAGLVDVGPRAIERLRDSLGREDDPTNLATIARALGDWGDRVSVPELVRLLNDKNRPTALRTTILESLESSSQAAAARLALVRDSGSPPELVAHGIVRLARDGKVSADELLTFLAHADLSVRAAALKALAICPIGEIDSKSRRAISARLDDPSADVQRAAMTAISALKIDESTPRLIELAHQNDLRADAIEALTAMGRVQALPIYLDALGDRNPAIRRSAESALASIRDQVADELRSRARAGEFSGPTGQAIERILASYQPVTDWKVIGPFPRNAPDLSADSGPDAFGREHNGAGGRPIRWTSRRGDLKTGRVTLEDFEAQAGEPRDFGYDTNGSPDLAAYAYAEVQSAGEGMALARLGSSGTISVWVNSRLVHHADHAAGRPHSPVSDFLNIPLEKGVNTILVRSRQGIGTWSFSLQISDQTGSPILPTPARSPRESQREFALSHSGDPRRGKSIFFDPGGIGCAKCHSAAGQGTATVGPDLTGIGRQYDRAELIRSVLEPSSRVAAGYQPLVLATSDGTVVTGLLRGETESHIDLIDSDGKPNRLAKSELEARRVSETSLMPTGLTDSLSPSEFADLIAFLESLGKR